MCESQSVSVRVSQSVGRHVCVRVSQSESVSVCVRVSQSVGRHVCVRVSQSACVSVSSVCESRQCV